ncbi:hypothetical protein CAEBREN_12908 [Caenorhabditis brenneri]|uniref:Uncharacterized protein n=1 Tax=Caenorhabditis brenneri TaxID=135651 RepID=G0NDV9_CAEBE|nr:hypothetical protein CAEBREN_12908 [Caenorhabditis brenneri]
MLSIATRSPTICTATQHSVEAIRHGFSKTYRCGSITNLKDEFNCRYKKIDQIIGPEFEGLTSYTKSSLDSKTVGMEHHLLPPINLFSQENRFQKLNGKFNVISSDGISDRKEGAESAHREHANLGASSQEQRRQCCEKDDALQTMNPCKSKTS